MYGPSDRYGDMSLEDSEEFEGLAPEDGRRINPEGRFERSEFRSFESDFKRELREREENQLLGPENYSDEWDEEDYDNSTEDDEPWDEQE